MYFVNGILAGERLDERVDEACRTTGQTRQRLLDETKLRQRSFDLAALRLQELRERNA